MENYTSTQDQMNKEFASMHDRMRDPELHEKKSLEINQKKDVEQTTKRYGLD